VLAASRELWRRRAERERDVFAVRSSLKGRTAFGPGASAAVAATSESRLGIKGKAHGQGGTDDGYQL